MSISVLPSPEQIELRGTVRRLLGDPREAVDRLTANHQAHRRVWDALSEIGFFGILAPQEYGGFDGSLADVAGSLVELGRAMPPIPVLTSLLTIHTLTHSSADDAKARWLPPLIQGDRSAAVVVDGACLSAAEDPSSIAATPRGDGSWSLQGRSGPALFAGTVDSLLVQARRPDGTPALLVVDTADDALGLSPIPTLDGSRPFAAVTFDAAPAALVASGEEAERLLLRLGQLGAFLLAAEATGGADRCFDICREFVTVREQFGRPIGAFQALRHRLSDLFVEIEASTSLVSYGAAVHSDDADAFTAATLMAKSHCVDTFTRAADEAIQMQGGIGFTWENEAHHHLKRAKTADVLFGSAPAHREHLAALLLSE